MSPKIAQKSTELVKNLIAAQWAIFQMGYFEIALGLKLD